LKNEIICFVSSFKKNVNSILDEMTGIKYLDENTSVNILNSKSKLKRVEFGNKTSTNSYILSRLRSILSDLDELSNKLN
jgi:hypothetical protein